MQAGALTPTSGSMDLAAAARDFAIEIRGFLHGLDGLALGDDAVAWAQAALERVRACGRAVEAAFDALADSGPAEERLRRAVVGLLELIPEPDQVRVREDLGRIREAMSPAYAALAQALTSEPDVQHLRPSNYARNAFHIGMGVGAALAFEHVFTPDSARLACVFMLVWAWSMEVSRALWPRVNGLLMWAFQWVSHPHEAARVNSATWYVSAVFFVALVSPNAAGVAALVVLSVGDPVAALIGRRYGRTRLLNGRSLEGTSAFALVGGIAAMLFLLVHHPELSIAQAALVAGAASVAGALAELFTRRLDDNLTIPVAATLAAMVPLAWM